VKLLCTKVVRLLGIHKVEDCSLVGGGSSVRHGVAGVAAATPDYSPIFFILI